MSNFLCKSSSPWSWGEESFIKYQSTPLSCGFGLFLACPPSSLCAHPCLPPRVPVSPLLSLPSGRCADTSPQLLRNWQGWRGTWPRIPGALTQSPASTRRCGKYSLTDMCCSPSLYRGEVGGQQRTLKLQKISPASHQSLASLCRKVALPSGREKLFSHIHCLSHLPPSWEHLAARYFWSPQALSRAREECQHRCCPLLAAVLNYIHWESVSPSGSGCGNCDVGNINLPRV